MPNTATTSDTPATALRTDHPVLDLATAFSSIALDSESQDQSAFTWEGQQRTFQVLPQGYLYNPTLCPVMVARNLSLFFPTPLKWVHHTDDIMLTCEDLPLLNKTLQALLDLLPERGRAVNLHNFLVSAK